MEAVEAFKPYRNQFGAVTPTGQVTQNDILFTAYYLLCLLYQGHLLPDTEFVRIVKAMGPYMNSDGSTRRTPESLELDSHDNLTGWAVLSYFLYPMWAKKILEYARFHEWTWPGVEPTMNRYLGRHRVVEPVLQIAAGEKPDLLTGGIYALNAVISAFASKSNQDSFSLNYAMSRIVLDKFKFSGAPLIMVVGAAFWKIVQAIRGRTMAKNLTDYGWGSTPYVLYID